MSAKIATATSHELCTSVRHYFSDFAMNSYNRYDKNKAIWWLTPTSENPSYKYAKLCFMPDERVENIMLTGLYVEKGLGKSYCEVYGAAKTKKLAMDGKWGWHRVLEAMKDGKMSKALQQITDATGVKPLVMLSGQYSQLDFDPDAHRLKAETIYYGVDGTVLKEVDYRPSPDKNPLGSLRKASSMQELADRLFSLPEADFIWIDMAFVLPMQIDQESTETVTAETLAKKVLLHFASWVTV
ncbi:MAG: hypothetical protein AB9919_13040 [Geobacteraceae bacterium]